MSSYLHRGLARLVVVASVGLSSPFPAGCSVNDVTFTEIDTQAPPTTATLTIVRNDTAIGTVSSSPGGIACGAVCTASFPSGTTVTLTATPDAGAEFTGWSGGCSGAVPTCVVTVDTATTVTATFDRLRYPVTVDLGGSGTGMVVAPAAGISCPGSCTAMVAHGDQFALDATAGAVSLFMGWTVGPGGTACAGTGACATTITGSTTITATFARYQALEVTRSGNGSGTVTSNPAGIDCGTDCSELYPPGTTVTLTATPADDSTFAGWSGACSGTGPCNVDVNGATMATADFRLRQYDLTVAKVGTGAGTVTSSPAGIDCGTDCTEVVDHGAMVTLTATAAVGSTFTGWSGGGCIGTGTCAVPITAITTVTATFALNIHTLSVAKAGAGAGTVTSSPTGISCGTDCSEVYAPGATVTLTATPSASSTFSGWSGGGCSGTSTCTVTMTAATTVTATFTLNQYKFQVFKTGSGGGGVVFSPTGSSCGFLCNQYPHGTTVTVTATPVPTSIFGGWSGVGGASCTGTTCTATMTSDVTLSANFQELRWVLTVAKAGTGSGTVTSSPGGINCGTTCSQAVLNGSTVTLTATPSAGSTFAGWSGGGCTGTGTCTVMVTASTTVNATFVPGG